MQNLTPLTPERQTKLAAQRKGARRMIRLVIELVELLVQLEVWEWPLPATSWNLPEMQKILKMLPFKSRADGCAFGMKAADVDEFVLKSWRLQCRTEEQAQRLNLQCQKNHLHVPIEGAIRTNATAYYPRKMALRFVRGLLKKPDMKDVARRLGCVECLAVDLDPERTESEPSKGEIERIMKLLTKVHCNSAHCSNRTLARVLHDDGAPQCVVKLAQDFKCDTCLAHSRPQIKPVTSLTYETRLWHKVAIDQAEFERPDSVVCFQLYVEGASQLCVPHVLFERNKDDHRNATGQAVTDSFAETWLSHYPKPARVKTDPEGAFQSNEFREFLSTNIEYEPTAGEAHWQNGEVERKVQVIKRIAQKLSTEFPTASGKQILGAACAANNELERCRHYSPNQWAFGMSKPSWEEAITIPSDSFKDVMELRLNAQKHWLKEKAHERLLIAQRAKTRTLVVWKPGTKCMVWRAGKGTKTKPGWGGKWLGPGIVLIHQTTSDGGPSKVVWISLGGRLYRVAPEHLRQTTEREGILFDMNFPRIGEDPNELLKAGEFTDLTGTARPTPEDVEMGDRVVPHREPPPRRIGQKRTVPERKPPEGWEQRSWTTKCRPQKPREKLQKAYPRDNNR